MIEKLYGWRIIFKIATPVAIWRLKKTTLLKVFLKLCARLASLFQYFGVVVSPCNPCS